MDRFTNTLVDTDANPWGIDTRALLRAQHDIQPGIIQYEDDAPSLIDTYQPPSAKDDPTNTELQDRQLGAFDAEVAARVRAAINHSGGNGSPTAPPGSGAEPPQDLAAALDPVGTDGADGAGLFAALAGLQEDVAQWETLPCEPTFGGRALYTLNRENRVLWIAAIAAVVILVVALIRHSVSD
jgi:hypothetical protein